MRIQPRNIQRKDLRNFQTAKNIMASVDEKQALVKSAAGSDRDLVAGPGVGVADFTVITSDTGMSTIDDALLKGGKFEYSQSSYIQHGMDLSSQKEEGSRVETDETITYEHKMDGTKSTIVLDKATQDIEFKQDQEVMGGLITWKLVD